MVAPTVAPRTVHVEHCMGTVFSIDVRGEGRWDDAIGEVVELLHHVDRVFSTYRADSDICRMQRRELRAVDAHPDVATVLDLCATARSRTDGWFTALHGGRLDPTGLVKGWAVERASRLLRERGSTDHAVNGGGDIQLAGGPAPGEAWRVAVVDPADRTRAAAMLTVRDGAVATSGTAERGRHVLDPFTGEPARGAASATVVGRSLTFADAYATAACAMGGHAPAWIETVPGYELLLVDADGRQRVSSGWRRVAAGR